MRKVVSLIISFALFVLQVVAGGILWFWIGFAACFEANCRATDIENLFPNFIFLMVIIIAPQISYYFYKSTTGGKRINLKWNILFTLIVMLIAIIAMILTVSINSRIELNSRIKEFESINYNIYTSPLASANKFYNIKETSKTHSQYSSIYSTKKGRIDIVGGEYSSELKSILGMPPCKLLEADNYMAPGSKVRTVPFRYKESIRSKCEFIDGLYIITARSPKNPYIYYTSYNKDDTILLFRSKDMPSSSIFAQEVNDYIETLQPITINEAIKEEKMN